jgi:hypothetical protein
MFDNLENILKLIVEKLETQEELLQLTISNLTTKKDVARFLNKSVRTIDNYISKNIFKENIHYFYNEVGTIEFIPVEVVKFKKNPNQSKQDEHIKKEDKKYYHPAVAGITKGLKVG